MSPVRARTLIWLAAMLTVLVAGCGGAGSSALPTTLTVATQHGLSYTLTVSGSGKTACTTQTYRTSLPAGQPVLQSSHLCGQGIVFGYPLLVQSQMSTQSILVDVPGSTCGKVLATARRAALAPLASHCSATTPAFRVTVLPAVRRLVVHGITGIPVINFPRHVCKKPLCINTLKLS